MTLSLVSSSKAPNSRDHWLVHAVGLQLVTPCKSDSCNWNDVHVFAFIHDCLGWVVGKGGGVHQAIFAFVVWLKVDDEILSNAHLYEVSSHCFSLTLAVRCLSLTWVEFTISIRT